MVERILAELKTGLPRGQIAKNLGCSKGYVTLVYKTKDTGGKIKKFTARDRIQAAYLWGADHCVTEISQKLGVGKLRIIRFLQSEGFIDAQS